MENLCVHPFLPHPFFLPTGRVAFCTGWGHHLAGLAQGQDTGVPAWLLAKAVVVYDDDPGVADFPLCLLISQEEPGGREEL